MRFLSDSGQDLFACGHQSGRKGSGDRRKRREGKEGGQHHPDAEAEHFELGHFDSPFGDRGWSQKDQHEPCQPRKGADFRGFSDELCHGRERRPALPLFASVQECSGADAAGTEIDCVGIDG
jgi:hypothetical protein